MSSRDTADSNSPSPQEPVEVGGATAVYNKPKQIGYVLCREEYELLSQGDTASGEQRWGDVCFSWFLSALLTFLGIFATQGIETIFDPNRKFGLVVVLLLAALSLTALGLAINSWCRAYKLRKSPGHLRVKKTLEEFFRTHAR